MTVLESARETVASLSDKEGWGADVEAIRAGRKDDYRVRIAAQAITDYFSRPPSPSDQMANPYIGRYT